jgi:hypothetical protein
MSVVMRRLVAFVMGILVFLLVFGIGYVPFGAHLYVWVVAAAAGLGMFAGLTKRRSEPDPFDELPDVGDEGPSDSL